MGTSCRVNSCCCGCSLRTGSLIIAIMDLLSALAVFIFAIVILTDDAFSYNWDDYFDVDGTSFYYRMSGLFYTMAVMSSILLVIDILLLIGILGGRVRLIIPWIFFSYVAIFFNIVSNIWLGVAYIDNNDFSLGYSAITSAVISFGIKLYFIMVIRSYANTLAEGINFSNGVNVTVYPSTFPQAYPNGQQPFYPTVNVQQTGYPNGQPSYPNGQPQMNPNAPPPYPSGQQQMYPNGQQAFPNVQQTYPNSQVSGQNGQPLPYPIGQPQLPLPPMSEMKRDL